MARNHGQPPPATLGGLSKAIKERATARAAEAIEHDNNRGKKKRMTRRTADLVDDPLTGMMHIVIAEVGGDRRSFRSSRAISTDLPADAVGEHLTELIQRAWKAGIDPVNMTIVVSFS